MTGSERSNENDLLMFRLLLIYEQSDSIQALLRFLN